MTPPSETPEQRAEQYVETWAKYAGLATPAQRLLLTQGYLAGWHSAGSALHEAAQREAALREALQDVLDPIAKIKRELQPGYVLDGAACVQALRDPETYKAIARAALAAQPDRRQ